MTRLMRQLARLVFIAVSILLASCGSSPPVKYYTLSPQLTAGASAMGLVIKIGPVEFPAALDRSQIVTRLSSTQVEVNQFNVWSAPLDHQFLKVLGDNLGSALGTPWIVVYPNEASVPIDYQVPLDVLQFEGEKGGSVTLRVRWAISTPDGKALDSGLFAQSRPTANETYDALVASHSELVAMLATALVSRIDELPSPSSH